MRLWSAAASPRKGPQPLPWIGVSPDRVSEWIDSGLRSKGLAEVFTFCRAVENLAVKSEISSSQLHAERAGTFGRPPPLPDSAHKCADLAAEYAATFAADFLHTR